MITSSPIPEWGDNGNNPSWAVTNGNQDMKQRLDGLKDIPLAMVYYKTLALIWMQSGGFIPFGKQIHEG